jgi:flagellin-specific chaperone FliS
MPKQVEPLSVLRPATEIITSARVRIHRAKKHIAKLNNLELDNKLHKATLIIEQLENIVKAELRKAQKERGK